MIATTQRAHEKRHMAAAQRDTSYLSDHDLDVGLLDGTRREGAEDPREDRKIARALDGDVHARAKE